MGANADTDSSAVLEGLRQRSERLRSSFEAEWTANRRFIVGVAAAQLAAQAGLLGARMPTGTVAKGLAASATIVAFGAFALGILWLFRHQKWALTTFHWTLEEYQAHLVPPGRLRDSMIFESERTRASAPPEAELQALRAATIFLLLVAMVVAGLAQFWDA